jgi:hypothetical protein
MMRARAYNPDVVPDPAVLILGESQWRSGIRAELEDVRLVDDLSAAEVAVVAGSW